VTFLIKELFPTPVKPMTAMTTSVSIMRDDEGIVKMEDQIKAITFHDLPSLDSGSSSLRLYCVRRLPCARLCFTGSTITMRLSDRCYGEAVRQA
jgi:hypothetical protein